MNYYYNEISQGYAVTLNGKTCNFNFIKLEHNRCTLGFDIYDDSWRSFTDTEINTMLDFLLAQNEIQLLIEEINNG